ncbi:MAG TPA: hypothetical protein VE262_10150 [Blastocatellia bacterium]|nr:hypothetical protein [Blastocatellia bacterium]
MKIKLRLFFPALAVLFMLSTTGYSHETGIPHVHEGEHEFEIYSELSEAVVPTPAAHANELTRVPAVTAESVSEYLKTYVKKVAAYRASDEELEEGEGGGFCGRCYPCHLGCRLWDGHFNNCNGAVCWCIGEPPYSGCLSGGGSME